MNQKTNDDRLCEHGVPLEWSCNACSDAGRTQKDRERDNAKHDGVDFKAIHIPDDAAMHAKIAQTKPGQFAVFVQIEGAEDNAWMIDVGALLQMAQNPPGVVIPQAIRQSPIHTPPEKKIIA